MVSKAVDRIVHVKEPENEIFMWIICSFDSRSNCGRIGCQEVVYADFTAKEIGDKVSNDIGNIP